MTDLLGQPMFAAFDQIIFLVIFAALAGLSSWLTKRRQEAAEREARQRRPEPEDDSVDAEALLRRLLGGEPPVAVPPPLPRTATGDTAPRVEPPAQELPPIWESEGPHGSPAPLPPLPSVLQGEPIVPKVLPTPAPRAPRPARKARLAPAAPTGPVVHPRFTAAAARVAASLRRPSSARQAFLMAQVLGRPRGLER